MSAREEYAWAAGFFEGEGSMSICTSKTKGDKRLVLQARVIYEVARPNQNKSRAMRKRWREGNFDHLTERGSRTIVKT